MSGFVLCVDSPQAQAGLLQAKQQVAKSEVRGAVKSEVKSKVKEVPGKVANEPKSELERVRSEVAAAQMKAAAAAAEAAKINSRADVLHSTYRSSHYVRATIRVTLPSESTEHAARRL